MHSVRRAGRYVDPRPGVMVYVATSGGTFSIRPWEPFQYLSNSCRRAASSFQRPMLTVLQPLMR